MDARSRNDVAARALVEDDDRGAACGGEEAPPATPTPGRRRRRHCRRDLHSRGPRPEVMYVLKPARGPLLFFMITKLRFTGCAKFTF